MFQLLKTFKTCSLLRLECIISRLLSSQSEQSEKFSKSPDWLVKSRPSKKATFALIM